MSSSEQNKAAVRDCFEHASKGNFGALHVDRHGRLRRAPGGGPGAGWARGDGPGLPERVRGPERDGRSPVHGGRLRRDALARSAGATTAS